MFSGSDWLLLSAYGLMTSCGLIALLVPPRHLGLVQRPLAVIVTMLPVGVLGSLSLLAKLRGWGERAEVGLLGLQLLVFAGIVVTAVAARRVSRMKTPVNQAPVELAVRPSLEREVRSLVEQRRVIQAVKLVRDRTGISLSGAKAAVDRVRG